VTSVTICVSPAEGPAGPFSPELLAFLPDRRLRSALIQRVDRRGQKTAHDLGLGSLQGIGLARQHLSAPGQMILVVNLLLRAKVRVALRLFARKIRFLRNDARPRVPDAAVHRVVRVGRGRHGVHLLHVLGDDDRGYRARRQRDAQRAIDDVTQRRRRRNGVDVFRNILEEHLKVDFLLIRTPKGARRGLADNRYDRRMIHLCIVKPVEQVHGAGAGRSEAESDFAGELRMCARRERGDPCDCFAISELPSEPPLRREAVGKLSASGPRPEISRNLAIFTPLVP